jgi:hypothetical protein
VNEKTMQQLKKLVNDLRTEVLKAELPAKNYKMAVKNELIRKRFATIANRIDKAIEKGK